MPASYATKKVRRTTEAIVKRARRICVWIFVVITVWFCGLFSFGIFLLFAFVSSVFGICRHIHTVANLHAHTQRAVWPFHIKRMYCLFTFQRAQDRVIRSVFHTLKFSMKFFSIHLYFSTHYSCHGSSFCSHTCIA